MSAVTKSVADSGRRAAGEVADALTALEVATVQLERELEEARQELGRARVYNEALATVLRRIADENVEAVVDPGDVLFEVRELLGLDGRTGSRDVSVERQAPTILGAKAKIPQDATGLTDRDGDAWTRTRAGHWHCLDGRIRRCEEGRCDRDDVAAMRAHAPLTVVAVSGG